MAAERDDFSSGYVKRVLVAGVSAIPYLEGVVPWFEGSVDRVIIFD
jgi:hypothetical protein